MFVLLGRDTLAPILVRAWALMREQLCGPGPKVDEARQCAQAMLGWGNEHTGAADAVEKAFNWAAAHDAIVGMNAGRLVTVARADYERLKTDSVKLNKLEAAGVDNWEGYGDALAAQGDPGDEHR